MFQLRFIISIFLIGFIINESVSQSTDDALRFAIYQPMGTARSMGIGNALSSLGGDFFTMSHNPAGLASYRNSEFTFTQGFQSTGTKATLQNSPTFEDQDFDFMLGSVGLVIANTQTGSKWKAVNFGIGYNRHTNYDRSLFYSGSTEGSITDLWLLEYRGSDDLSPYGAGLAANSDVFIDVGNGDVSTDYQLDGKGALAKQEIINSAGGHGEMTVGFAANYNHRLFFGLTLGVPISRYESSRIYEEEQERQDDNTYFRSLTYRENLEQSGSGVNAKLGLIYRVNQAFRVSGYFHTPTVLSILDEFDNELEYSYFDADRNIVTAGDTYPPTGEGTLNFEYQVITPARVGGGASFIIGKNGFISAEVGYTDYSNTRFHFDRDLSSSADLNYERELNNSIDERYSGALNVNVGGELALDIFRVRLGTALVQSPFANDNSFSPTYTAGVGLRINKFFIDLAYRRSQIESTHVPYFINESLRDDYPIQTVKTKTTDHDVFLTLGFKF